MDEKDFEILKMLDRNCRISYSKIAKQVDIQAVQNRCVNKVTGSKCYEQFQMGGLLYGPRFQVIQHILYDSSEALSKIVLSSDIRDTFHSFLLNSIFLNILYDSLFLS